MMIRYGAGILGLGLAALLPALPLCAEAAQQNTGRHWAVIVGITDYPGVPPLKYSVRDALLFQKALDTASERVLLLTSEATEPDRRPTKANIMNALRSVAAKADRADTIWFYFSGHGLHKNEGSYLIPQDFRLDDIRTFVAVREIRALLEDPAKCRAKSRVVILDACHSGGAKGLAAATSDPSLQGWQGTITAAASRLDRQAWELPDLEHGVFTYYLVRGLAGMADRDGDRVVTLAEVKEYVVSNVNEQCRKNVRPEQDPQFFYRGSPDVRLTVRNEALLAELNGQAGSRDLVLVVRESLKPGLIVLLRGEQGETMQAEVKRLFANQGFPLVVDEAAQQFETVLSGVDTKAVAQQVEKMNSRFLLRGSVKTKVEPDPLGVAKYRATASVNAELVDASGRVLGSFSDTRTGSGLTDQDSTQRALKAVAAQLYKEMLSKVERVLRPEAGEASGG